MPAIRFVAMILTASVAVSGPSLAHAFLKSATPPVGSTVQAAPANVVIDYTEGVEPKFSAIEVQDAGGARVDSGDVQTATGNNKRLTVGLKPLRPGSYKVIWHVTSTDTHKTEGTYTFTVTP
jgi:methionine-rich copper-binding protein CopC